LKALGVVFSKNNFIDKHMTPYLVSGSADYDKNALGQGKSI